MCPASSAPQSRALAAHSARPVRKISPLSRRPRWEKPSGSRDPRPAGIIERDLAHDVVPLGRPPSRRERGAASGVGGDAAAQRARRPRPRRPGRPGAARAPRVLRRRAGALRPRRDAPRRAGLRGAASAGGRRPGEHRRPGGHADAAVIPGDAGRAGRARPVPARRGRLGDLPARVAQGGSTITQQLVKNRLLDPKRTFMRKLDEAWLATLVEWRYSKERILEAYLNEVYLGQRGPMAIRGVSSASRAYFGKEVHELTVAESALLAGMIRAPNTYSPSTNPARARERRDVVLGRMRELGRLSEADYQEARREAVRAPLVVAATHTAPYSAAHVRQEP